MRRWPVKQHRQPISHEGTFDGQTFRDANQILTDVMAARERMLESIADLDDDLMDALLSGKDADKASIQSALRKAVHSRRALPVFCGASLRNRGVPALLDAVVSPSIHQ